MKIYSNLLHKICISFKKIIQNNNNLSDAEREFINCIEQIEEKNSFFTKEFIILSLKNLIISLNKNDIDIWLNGRKENIKSMNIGLITASNIPLVGLNDILCILITGNNLYLKTSSKDFNLHKLFCEIIKEIEPKMSNRIFYVEDKLENIDKIIATGGNNAANYFDYYFGKENNLIRKNRNSIAILNDNESDTDLKNLSNDVFEYFGLGCRSVSKIFIPLNYDIQKLFKNFERWKDIINHNKYANNYNYYRTIYLISKINFWDNGFVILYENKELSSPVSVVYFEYYSDIMDLNLKVENIKNEIQCIVSNFYTNAIPFGTSQCPKLYDYADNLNTLDFLTNI